MVAEGGAFKKKKKKKNEQTLEVNSKNTLRLLHAVLFNSLI